MYSEKLEEVISAALADGNLTEQKRKIIMRRAEKEGEDVEEVMMVVESRLLNQTKKQSNQSQSKSESKEEVSNGDFIETVNGVSFKMIKVEGGRFTMFTKKLEYTNQAKAQDVILDDYYICDTVVTQELWKAVMGSNFHELCFKGAKLPVNNILMEECCQFINKLNALTKKKYHLPSEAQWEYAAMGGKKSLGFNFAGSDDIKKVGWTCSNTENDKMKPVAQLRPNELGLYDMCGNCYEFCEDDYDDEPILNGMKNPIYKREGCNGFFFNVLRSCPFDYRAFSWGDRYFYCDALGRQNGYGFRIAL